MFKRIKYQQTHFQNPVRIAPMKVKHKHCRRSDLIREVISSNWKLLSKPNFQYFSRHMYFIPVKFIVMLEHYTKLSFSKSLHNFVWTDVLYIVSHVVTHATTSRSIKISFLCSSSTKASFDTRVRLHWDGVLRCSKVASAVHLVYRLRIY